MSESLTQTVREALAAALTSNGVGRSAPDGIHSWRCEYPNVYGPCTCFAELLDDLVAAVTLRLDAAERVVEAAEAYRWPALTNTRPGKRLAAALDAYRATTGQETGAGK